MGGGGSKAKALADQSGTLIRQREEQDRRYDRLIEAARHDLKECNSERIGDLQKIFLDVDKANRDHMDNWKDMVNKIDAAKDEIYAEWMKYIKDHMADMRDDDRKHKEDMEKVVQMNVGEMNRRKNELADELKDIRVTKANELKDVEKDCQEGKDELNRKPCDHARLEESHKEEKDRLTKEHNLRMIELKRSKDEDVSSERERCREDNTRDREANEREVDRCEKRLTDLRKMLIEIRRSQPGKSFVINAACYRKFINHLIF